MTRRAELVQQRVVRQRAVQQQGFTLVELLVVIAIIGVLVAILLPTVNVVRERARNLQCQNHLKELGAGVLKHAMDKERFPGSMETFGRQDITWFGTILAAVGSDTQADALKNGAGRDKNSNDAYMIYMSIAVCPADEQSDQRSPWLSYAANCGIWNAPKTVDTAANGLFHERRLQHLPAKTTPVNVGTEDIRDGQAQTLLLAENVDATVWAIPKNGTTKLREAAYGLTWPYESNKWLNINDGMGQLPQDDLLGNHENLARPSSRHAGYANMVFADGHVIQLSEEIGPEVFGQLMSPWGEKASIPWASNANLTFQKATITEDMYRK